MNEPIHFPRRSMRFLRDSNAILSLDRIRGMCSFTGIAHHPVIQHRKCYIIFRALLHTQGKRRFSVPKKLSAVVASAFMASRLIT